MLNYIIFTTFLLDLQNQRAQGGYEEDEGDDGNHNIDFENLDDIDEELLEAAFQQNVAAGGTTDKMEFLKDLVMAQRRQAEEGLDGGEYYERENDDD